LGSTAREPLHLVKGYPAAVMVGGVTGRDGLPGRMYLSQEIGREEGVLKSMSSQDDLVTSGELVDAVKDLIPGVLRHQAHECIQTDDSLFIKMVEYGGRQSIGIMRRPNSRINFK